MCENSYLGVQQTQAHSVVHDIAVVRRVPVAVKTVNVTLKFQC